MMPLPEMMLVAGLSAVVPSAGEVHKLGEKQISSKWFARQAFFVVAFHGMWDKSLHEEFIPVLDKVAAEMEGQVKVGCSDSRAHSSLAAIGVRTDKGPSLHLFRKGEYLKKWKPKQSWWGDATEDMDRSEIELAQVSSAEDDILVWLRSNTLLGAVETTAAHNEL
eukprot:gnl/TRDRNA2_/TRDRNA2_161919_c0_seq2.p2 gnl/TRDRNA2_/TRDRNA2_161919_c0~~gnl/TRDRNA2_/TRDRNA2_161919_c0_seq2.p2  ORF type:complete len:165 (-),score=43.30 gnl/TRDRNA2_/TRDRNA2_161919_c0_seq2:169-663(-)